MKYDEDQFVFLNSLINEYDRAVRFSFGLIHFNDSIYLLDYWLIDVENTC